jgi:acetolactate synthase-1/2/3 large subunit
MSAAEATVETLLRHGVDTIYGVPGIHNDVLFDAFWHKRNELRVIHARHEQTAAYMALGAALATGKPQVFSVVPGPGLLNASAAMLTASSLGAPVLGLIGQIPNADIDRGLGHLHELHDQLGLVRHFAKSAERINDPSEASAVTARAMHTIMSGRRGAATIECAIDMWGRSGPVEIENPRTPDHPPIDDVAVANVAALIAKARKPMIVLGGGAKDAGPEILALAERLEAPVASYRGGRDVIPSSHRLAINLPQAYRMWPEVDLVIGIGTRLQIQLQRWGVDANIKVVRIDIDPTEPDRLRKADAAIIGDAAEATRALVAQLPAAPRASREAELAPQREWLDQRLSQLEPQRSFLNALRAAIPDDGILLDDVTQLGFAGRVAYETRQPRTYLSPGYQDNLGWGYGTALGAKAAQPNKAVVAVLGDGGFMYQAAEFATAVAHNIGVVAVVFDNGVFGNVKRIQEEAYGGRMIACDLTNPDFVAFGKSFGADTYRVETPEALEMAVREAIAKNRPALVHVPCGEMPSPWDMLLAPRVRG